MECTICFRDYDLQILPMIGSCGHSFCKDCVSKFTSKCPNCQRKTFTQPRKNFLAIEMMESDSKAVKELKEIKAYKERLDQSLSAQEEQDKKLKMLLPTVKDLQTRLEEKSDEKSAAYQMVTVYTKKIESQDAQILKLNMELFEKTMEIFGKDRYIKELEQKLKTKGVTAEYSEGLIAIDISISAHSSMINKGCQSPGGTEDQSSSKDQLKVNANPNKTHNLKKMKRMVEDEDESPSKKIWEKSPPESLAQNDWDPDDLLLYRKIVCGQSTSAFVAKTAQ